MIVVKVGGSLYDHPQLGPVELGGWDTFRTWSNPPAALMEAEIAPHSTWAVAQALALPELAIHDVRTTPFPGHNSTGFSKMSDSPDKIV